MLIRLRVRRFFCGNPVCEAVTFAEQVDGLTGRYPRRSLPLLGLLAQIALALAGRAGARLAGVLGAPCTGQRCCGWSSRFLTRDRRGAGGAGRG